MKRHRFKCMACRGLLENTDEHCGQSPLLLPSWYREETHGKDALFKRQALRAAGDLNPTNKPGNGKRRFIRI